MNRILDAGFKQPASEHVLIQSRSARAGTTRLRLRGRGRRRADLEDRGRPRHPLAAQRRQRGPHLEGRTLRARRVQIRGAQGRGGRQDRPGPRRRRRRATRPSGLLDRRVRRRKRGEGSRDGVRGRPRQGGNALAPDHADRSRAHLRLARRGGYSAPARADRRLRDLRARRALERPAAGRDAGPGDGAPDRPRGRGRLLDVLLEARTAGASRGPQPAGGARHRRRHLRPLGAHLGPDRDRRDGRHVPDRRFDLRVACAGHDPRRRRRGARVADRASRPALAARGQGRPWTRSVRRPPPP